MTCGPCGPLAFSRRISFSNFTSLLGSYFDNTNFTLKCKIYCRLVGWHITTPKQSIDYLIRKGDLLLMNIMHLSGDDCITLVLTDDILKLRSYIIFIIYKR
jgi:hypothetical protein